MKKKQTKEQIARFVWKPGDLKVVKRSENAWKKHGKARDASRGR